MKKLLMIGLMISLAMSLVACGSKDKPSDPIDTPKQNDATKNIERGVVEGSTYKSSFGNVTITLDDSFHFSTDEEIAQIMQIDVEGLSSEELKESFEQSKLTNVYDLVAMNLSTGESYMVIIENLKIYGAIVDETKYFSILKENKMGEADGLTFDYDNANTVDLNGETFHVLEGGVQGSVYQYLFTKKVGNCMYTIIATGATEGVDHYLGKLS